MGCATRLMEVCWAGLDLFIYNIFIPMTGFWSQFWSKVIKQCIFIINNNLKVYKFKVLVKQFHVFNLQRHKIYIYDYLQNYNVQFSWQCVSIQYTIKFAKVCNFYHSISYKFKFIHFKHVTFVCSGNASIKFFAITWPSWCARYAGQNFILTWLWSYIA